MKTTFNAVKLYSILTLVMVMLCDLPAFSKVIKVPGFKAYQNDPSIRIEFETPPGMYEDVESEKMHGFYKIYLPNGENFEDSVMAIVVNCQKKSSKLNTLDIFIRFNVEYFRSIYPETKISILQLPEDVTHKLNTLKIPNYAVFLKSNSEVDISDNAVLFFETNKGLWSISYIAPEEAIKGDMRDIFLSFIKNMDLEVK